MTRYDERYEQRLVEAFHTAAMFLKAKVESNGWQWSSNYLREHVRCSTGMKFSNSISPDILRALRQDYPELRPYIEIGTLKGE